MESASDKKGFYRQFRRQESVKEERNEAGE